MSLSPVMAVAATAASSRSGHFRSLQPGMLSHRMLQKVEQSVFWAHVQPFLNSRQARSMSNIQNATCGTLHDGRRGVYLQRDLLPKGISSPALWRLYSSSPASSSSTEASTASNWRTRAHDPQRREGRVDMTQNRILDALNRSFRQMSDRQLRNPDFKRAEELLLSCIEDGRPIPPVAITAVLRRTARHKDPLLMESLMKAIQRSGAVLSPVHISCALYHYGVNIHSPGVHACARLMGEHPGPVPAALYTRLLIAYLGIGQYDRALRLLGDIRAASGIGVGSASPPPSPSHAVTAAGAGAVGGPTAAPPGYSDVGPILWAVLECLSQSFPIYPREQFSPVDLQRARHLQVASARARAAAEVLIRHYAVSVQPTTGEANALLAYLCHDAYISPYLYPGYMRTEGDALRHKAFAMSMLWHRDYGLDPHRCMAEDPSLPVLQEVEGKAAAGELEGPPVSVTLQLSKKASLAMGLSTTTSSSTSAHSSSGEAELESYSISLEETAVRGITDDPARRRAFQGTSTLSPSSVTGQALSNDHGEWIEMLGHALACKQIAQAAEPHVLARCMEALAEHLGPSGVSAITLKRQAESAGGGGGSAGRGAEADAHRRPVVAADSTPALAALSLSEVAAGHVSLPYWAQQRDPAACLWALEPPGTTGPAGFPQHSSGKPPLVAVLPDILLRENRLGADKQPLPPIFPPSEAHLRFIRERSPIVRMALASQGQALQSPISPSVPPPAAASSSTTTTGAGGGGVRPGTVSRLTKEEEAARKRLLLLATPMLAGSEQSRIVVLGPGFSSLSPYDYASCWTEAHLLSFTQQGERLARILAGLFLHLAPLDMAARQADFDTSAYPASPGAPCPVLVQGPEGAEGAGAGPGLRLRSGAHEMVFAALVHRQKTVAAAQVASHSSFVLGGTRLGSPVSVTSLAYGLFHLLPREQALNQIRYLFRTLCGNNLHISTHAALYASTHAFKGGRSGAGGAGMGAAGSGGGKPSVMGRPGPGQGAGKGSKTGVVASSGAGVEQDDATSPSSYSLSYQQQQQPSSHSQPAWPLPLVQVLLEMEQEARAQAVLPASTGAAMAGKPKAQGAGAGAGARRG